MEQSGVDEPPLAQVADADAHVKSLDVVKQAYDLLIDRFVKAPDPAALLAAAWDGQVREMLGAGMELKDASPPALPSNREQAWAIYRERTVKLLAEEKPPAELDLKSAAINFMARSLDEGHTHYLTPRQYQDFLSLMRGDVRYEGIGVRPTRPGVTISEVFPDSPAQKAGLQTGDQIIAVNGEATDGRTLEDVSTSIRGPEGTTVELVIFRPSTGETLTIKVVRAKIKIDFVRTEVLQGDIGYVRLLAFNEPSVAERIEKFVAQLPELKAKALILDLRGNGGGRVDVGVRLLNRFVKSGPLFQHIDRSGTTRVFSASGPGWTRPLPMVILVDGGTASMGEIFAQAMKEHGMARLVGKRTSGNVSAAQVFALNDGSAVQVTILEILSGKGEQMNRVGVAPDDEMEFTRADLNDGRDPQLEHSILYLREQIAKGR